MLLSLVLSGLCTALLALTQHLLFLLVVFGVLRSIAQSGSSEYHRRPPLQVVSPPARHRHGPQRCGRLVRRPAADPPDRRRHPARGLASRLGRAGAAGARARSAPGVCLRDDPAEMGLRPDGEAQPSAMEAARPARPGPLEAASWREAFSSCPCGNSVGGTLSAASRLPSSPPISCHSPSNSFSRDGRLGVWPDEWSQRGRRAGGGGVGRSLGRKHLSAACMPARLRLCRALTAPRHLEPVELCRHHGFFLVGDLLTSSQRPKSTAYTIWVSSMGWRSPGTRWAVL